ncbi:YqaE/Pmp3 family membrane protein [Leisingera methylohalidivorans]|uniref:Uncharacterized protein n=1 Tax=Leisingera methylohalidivorans DSM 14336 TaxID=999552 RepID=V9VUP8_9RHOB|nr:YqaE/Pmp3 family membrane protein [Leisingera methylohalidivorans]AHD00607.1 hypothetical protein METH_07760 [Leisingera methylohalidivorans DSM 14336]
MDLIRLIPPVIIPPLDVFTTFALRNHYLLYFLLSLFACMPGHCHAVYIAAKK